MLLAFVVSDVLSGPLSGLGPPPLASVRTSFYFYTCEFICCCAGSYDYATTARWVTRMQLEYGDNGDLWVFQWRSPNSAEAWRRCCGGQGNMSLCKTWPSNEGEPQSVAEPNKFKGSFFTASQPKPGRACLASRWIRIIGNLMFKGSAVLWSFIFLVTCQLVNTLWPIVRPASC